MERLRGRPQCLHGLRPPHHHHADQHRHHRHHQLHRQPGGRHHQLLQPSGNPSSLRRYGLRGHPHLERPQPGQLLPPALERRHHCRQRHRQQRHHLHPQRPHAQHHLHRRTPQHLLGTAHQCPHNLLRHQLCTHAPALEHGFRQHHRHLAALPLLEQILRTLPRHGLLYPHQHHLGLDTV